MTNLICDKTVEKARKTKVVQKKCQTVTESSKMCKINATKKHKIATLIIFSTAYRKILKDFT